MNNPLKSKEIMDEMRETDELEDMVRSFENSFQAFMVWVHTTMVEKGFHEDDRPISESIALMHSELSEALEADREGNPPSEKLDDFSEVEEEFADTIIRIMDCAKERDLNVAGAIAAKMNYNTDRDYKHGKGY